MLVEESGYRDEIWSHSLIVNEVVDEVTRWVCLAMELGCTLGGLKQNQTTTNWCWPRLQRFWGAAVKFLKVLQVILPSNQVKNFDFRMITHDWSLAQRTQHVRIKEGACKGELWPLREKKKAVFQKPRKDLRKEVEEVIAGKTLNVSIYCCAV